MATQGREEKEARRRAEWHDILTAFGWAGSAERLQELCHFLASEGLAWQMIGALGDPSEWAPSFSEIERRGLVAIAKNGKKRPRLTHTCWSLYTHRI